jgi:hypothetical protein
VSTRNLADDDDASHARAGFERASTATAPIPLATPAPLLTSPKGGVLAL